MLKLGAAPVPDWSFENSVSPRSAVWAPRNAEVVTQERLRVEREYVLEGGRGWEFRDSEVGAFERLPMGQLDVHGGGGGPAPPGAAVGARERLPVARGGVHSGGGGRTSRGAEVVVRERVPLEPRDVLFGGTVLAVRCVGLDAPEWNTRPRWILRSLRRGNV